jgi:SP family sugar:H+ symporter-like MFS transporter
MVFFFLYESSDLTLESVDMVRALLLFPSAALEADQPNNLPQMYNDCNCKPWHSRQWAPVGYASRYDLVVQTRAAQARKPLASGALEEKQIEHAPEPGTEPESSTAARGDNSKEPP